MRILEVVDSPWAIGKLAETIKNENAHHKIEILIIHPKEYRANPDLYNKIFSDKIEEFKPQLIHFHYWDTAKYLSELPVCQGIKKILTHHNQKNLLTHKWDNIDMLVVHTQKAKKILLEAGYWNVEVIQHGIDIERFKFKDEDDNDNRLLGYVGRIVPWKGLYEILKIAKELNTEVVMMGKIDKGDYWAKCQEFAEQMDIRFGTPDDKQGEVYHEMACYIGNSTDNIEEGTLGLLEAMASGIPVITTPSGEAMDIIKHGDNGLICEFDNEASLKTMIERFLNMTLEEKNEMRQNAWNTVRTMSKEVMARKYEKLYYSLIYRKDLVSVIIPTCKRVNTLKNVLDGYAEQSYSPIELVVVVDDNKGGVDIISANSGNITYTEKYQYEEVLVKWKKENDIPIKWLYTYNEGYGLAQARNMGIFEAGGNYIIFNDDRYVPEFNTVEAFVNNLTKRKNLSAVWGDKGAGKRDFMENFFIIRKRHIAQAGMFNERINEYGGQSQEVRERLRAQGFDLQFEPLAIAKTQFGTHNKTNRKYELFRSKLKLWKLVN